METWKQNYFPLWRALNSIYYFIQQSGRLMYITLVMFCNFLPLIYSLKMFFAPHNLVIQCKFINVIYNSQKIPDLGHWTLSFPSMYMILVLHCPYQKEKFIVYSRNNSLVVRGLTTKCEQHIVVIGQNFIEPLGSKRTANKNFPFLTYNINTWSHLFGVKVLHIY